MRKSIVLLKADRCFSKSISAQYPSNKLILTLSKTEPELKRVSIFLARTSSKTGTKSVLLGRMYEIAVRATRHVSAIISLGLFKNAESLYNRNSYSQNCQFTTLFAGSSERLSDCKVNVAINETQPSILSQIVSSSFAAWVFTIFDFYLSQVSNARLTNWSGSLIIYSYSDLVVLIRVKHTLTNIALPN